MKRKISIRKILFVALWLGIGSGMFLLLLAAISKKNHGTCQGYEIRLEGAQQNRFIDEKDVERMLSDAVGGPIGGRAVAEFSLHRLEQLLQRNAWISKAELYFDSQDRLHVTVTEREPVARVFATDGSSFYIDSTASRLPLSDKLSARVPVFTGFTPKQQWNAADSLLLKQVKNAALCIQRDPFLLAQVAQVDITADRNFLMVPVVGNHLVKLGDGEHMEAKFARLRVFYDQVLSKTGLERYKVIDVQYRGQVVASRFGNEPGVDSVQLRRNVDKLMKQLQEADTDTVGKTLAPVAKLEDDRNGELEPAAGELPVPAPKQPDRNGRDKPAPKPKAVMPPAPKPGNDHGYN